MTTAKAIGSIEYRDPHSHNFVAMQVYLHEGGGMFAIDESYLTASGTGIATLDPDDDDSDAVIPDPFANALEVPSDARLQLAESA